MRNLHRYSEVAYGRGAVGAPVQQQQQQPTVFNFTMPARGLALFYNFILQQPFMLQSKHHQLMTASVWCGPCNPI
jgi:hypothetical protein